MTVSVARPTFAEFVFFRVHIEERTIREGAGPGSGGQGGPAGLDGAHPSWVWVALVACAVIGLGAGQAGLIRPPAALAEADVRRLRIVGGVTVLVGLVALWAFRERFRTEKPAADDPTGGSLRMAAIIMGVLAWIAVLAPTADLVQFDGAESTAVGGRTVINPDLPPADGVPPPTPAPPTPPRLDGSAPDEASEFQPTPEPELQEAPERLDGLPPSSGSDAQGDRNLIFVMLALVLAIVVTSALALARGRLPTSVGEGSLDLSEQAADAEAGIAASLAAIDRHGGDPRSQITAAYHALLAALIDAGAAREPHHAPHEHLYRVLGPLGVRPQPLHALAALYVQAQFSERVLTDRERLMAAEALETSLDDLREANRSGPGEARAAQSGRPA